MKQIVSNEKETMKQMDEVLSWPPAYTIQRHVRAKSIKFRISPTGQLFITMPPRASLKQIPELLEVNKTWLMKHLQSAYVIANQADSLPNTIALPLFNHHWQISYCQMNSKFEWFIKPNNELQFIGNLEDRNLIKRSLVMWLKDYAKDKIILLFDNVSKEINLSYRDITLRSQVSLWGSCTGENSINLNYKLMFLSAQTVRYVMVHELCHTVHHNHSRKFWRLVQSHDPDFELHRRQLRTENKQVPAWF